MYRMTEVNLAANLKVLTELKPELKVDVIGLSPAGAYIRSLNSPNIGDQILLNLITEEAVQIKGEVKQESRNSESQKVLYISFESLNPTQTQAVEQITNYYLKLKKAGVQLDTPFEEGQKIN